MIDDGSWTTTAPLPTSRCSAGCITLIGFYEARELVAFDHLRSGWLERGLTRQPVQRPEHPEAAVRRWLGVAGFELFRQSNASACPNARLDVRRHARFPQRISNEASLRFAASAPRDRAEGIFGPASVTGGSIGRQPFSSAPAKALLLQLAHPWVAAAIADQSLVFADPIGRFHRTFNVMFTMVFGTPDQALAVARRLCSAMRW